MHTDAREHRPSDSFVGNKGPNRCPGRFSEKAAQDGTSAEARVDGIRNAMRNVSLEPPRIFGENGVFIGTLQLAEARIQAGAGPSTPAHQPALPPPTDFQFSFAAPRSGRQGGPFNRYRGFSSSRPSNYAGYERQQWRHRGDYYRPSGRGRSGRSRYDGSRGRQ